MLRYQGVENNLFMKINTQSKDCMKYFRKGLGLFWRLLSKNTEPLLIHPTSRHFVSRHFGTVDILGRHFGTVDILGVDISAPFISTE